jgi:Pyridoxamine 5'-phosphate oxidase
MASEDDLWRLVVAGRQGVLATVARDGRPQLSNVLYLADAASRVLRISTTARRVKSRNLAREPRAAHAAGGARTRRRGSGADRAGDDQWHPHAAARARLA